VTGSEWPTSGSVPSRPGPFQVTVPQAPPRPPYSVPPGTPPRPVSPPAAPATAAVPTDVPQGVIRTRAELESLRDDARRLLDTPGPHFELPWLDSRFDHDGISGVLNAVTWLLGERELAPISNDLREQVLPPIREIGRESIRAEDCIYRRKWTELTEWYGGGVLRTLDWATVEHKGGKPRPIQPL